LGGLPARLAAPLHWYSLAKHAKLVTSKVSLEGGSVQDFRLFF